MLAINVKADYQKFSFLNRLLREMSLIKSVYHKARNYTLYQGDCLEILAKIPKESVDLIFADPPYNLSNNGFTVQSGRRVSVNKGSWDASKGVSADFEFHQAWIQACRRVLKTNGTIWISGTYHSIYQCAYALQLNDFQILNDIVWFKPNASPNISCRYFTASHETLVWAKKDSKAKHHFNYQEMKGGDWHENDILKNQGKQMRSVWSIPVTKKSEKLLGYHPTQKPMELLKRVILASSNPGQLVLDPFCGSGTTGVVAVSNNRKFIGIDLSNKYLELAKLRIEEGKISIPKRRAKTSAQK